jgi:hypothetical protein
MAKTIQTQKETEAEKAKLAPLLKSKWSSRFLWAAIIEGFAAVLVTLPAIDTNLRPSVAMVMASGEAGTWLVMGYVLFIAVGVLGVGLTALFYHHFEVVLNKPYRGIANYLAWTHLLLMTVGVSVACGLLMYGGYFAGGNMLPVADGGLAWTALQAHVNILSGLENPIGYAIGVACIGVLAGGLGFVISYFRRMPYMGP